VAPHSAYLCSPETLKSAKALADRYQAPILIHLSEVADEVKTIKERYGRPRPSTCATWASCAKGVLGAHGVWLSESDRAILKAADVGIAHCPQSNMKLSSGAAPVKAMLAEGIRLGLGTDGAASNNDLDMFEEMDSAAMLAKHASGDPTAAPAPAVLEMATLGGARASGWRIASAPSRSASERTSWSSPWPPPRLHPLYDPVSHLVYVAKGADVRDVVIEGHVVMRDPQGPHHGRGRGDPRRRGHARQGRGERQEMKRPASAPWAGLLTESRNPRSERLDTLPTSRVVGLLARRRPAGPSSPPSGSAGPSPARPTSSRTR
jgi:5-methylthioadenosine/S-adenosylhomocysteine deaminase